MWLNCDNNMMSMFLLWQRSHVNDLSISRIVELSSDLAANGGGPILLVYDIWKYNQKFDNC